jgi:hypothetical protein
MLKPDRCFTVSFLLGGALSLWACTSGQSLPNGNLPGSGGMAGSGYGGTGGGTGGITYYKDYMCNGTPSGYPCGGTTATAGNTGAGGAKGNGGTTGRDATVEVGPVDAPSSEEMPDYGATETSTVIIDSALMDSTGMDSAGIDSDGILRGYQVYGNELMAFEPCGSSELIWMNLSGWEKGLDRIPAQSCPVDASLGMCVRHMYTELTGVISPAGHYGHLGKYSRQLTVQEFLDVTLAESPTCPFVPPVYPN